MIHNQLRIVDAGEADDHAALIRRGPRRGEAHVWAVPLEGAGAPLVTGLLSDAERTRMERFVHAVDGRRYAHAHGAMRIILGWYLDRAGESVELEPDELGKPRVAGTELQVSLAHANDQALVAVGRRWPLGVDIERVRELPDAEAFKLACFTERERALLDDAADESELIKLWTRKEALLKATGEGLRTAPREVEVLTPEPRPGWQLADLTPAAGYVGAVAVGAKTRRVVLARFNWPAPR